MKEERDKLLAKWRGMSKSYKEIYRHQKRDRKKKSEGGQSAKKTEKRVEKENALQKNERGVERFSSH